jgi:ABC-type uncharacterized transport system substrate-binding protein
MVAFNDPVEQGFVSSLAHPGGNITGFALINFQMVGKWLEMLKEAAPGVSRAALMFNPPPSVSTSTSSRVTSTNTSSSWRAMNGRIKQRLSNPVWHIHSGKPA